MSLVLKHPVMYLRDHKEKLNGFLSIFLLTYFILIFLPYIVADIPFLNNFFMGSTTKLIYRGFTCLYFGVYTLILAVANDLRLKWPFAIGGIVLILTYILSIIFVPKTYTYSLIDLTHKVTFISFNVGTYSYVTYLFSFIADIVFFTMFISFVPPVMKSFRQLNLTLYVLIGFMIFACGYSLIKERNEIWKLITGGSEYNINVRSVFRSKNAFGLFLFVGSLASAFIIFTTSETLKGYRWLFLIPLIGFVFMSLLCMCKTGLICGALLLFGIFLYQLIFVKNKYSIMFYVIAILISILLILYILFMTIPALHSGPLAPLYNAFINMFNKIFSGFASRTDRWAMVKYVVQGPFMLIGVNETNSAFLLDIVSQIKQGLDFTDFHSGYVTWYAAHGLIGVLFYGGLLGYIVYRCAKIVKIREYRRYGFLAIMLLIAGLVFMIPESYVLFISISSYAFIINLIIIAFIEFMNRKVKNNEQVC